MEHMHVYTMSKPLLEQRWALRNRELVAALRRGIYVRPPVLVYWMVAACKLFCQEERHPSDGSGGELGAHSRANCDTRSCGLIAPKGFFQSCTLHVVCAL